MIDLPSPSSCDAAQLRQIVAEIGRGEVDAFYLHLAEGQADNQRSKNEFGRLVQDYQGLTSATVLIHGAELIRIASDLEFVVPLAGLEPATCCLGDSCSVP
jgi:5-methylthioadenosine/S-adenosylhomocysteine deaminase